MKLEFARGDSYEKGFVLQDHKTGERITEQFDEVYFTVKRNSNDPQPLLQKRMTTGGIENDGDGHYTIFILPDDTNKMGFGTYDCDIEFVKGENEFKKTFVGTLTLGKEVTHKANE